MAHITFLVNRDRLHAEEKVKKAHQKTEKVLSIRELKCQEEEIDNTTNKYDLASLFVVLYFEFDYLLKCNCYLYPPPPNKRLQHFFSHSQLCSEWPKVELPYMYVPR